MTQATIIRAKASGERTTVRLLMAHEMESGQRKDTVGRTVPAWFIREVSVALNGRPVLSAQWGPSVAKNPFMQFVLKGGRPGDRVAVTWVDNHGQTRTDEAAVT